MKTKEKVNIYRVAELSGVSAMTVTRTFNNSEKISPVTRDKIFKIAKKLNYQPNYFARGIRGSNTKSVGMLMSMGAIVPVNEKIRTISAALSEMGYSAYVTDSFSDVDRICKILEDFIAKKIELLFFQTAYKRIMDKPEIKKLLSQIPAVLIESFWKLDIPCDQIITDRSGPIREIAEHFCKSGRTRTIIISAKSEGALEAAGQFAEVIRSHGIAPLENMLVEFDPREKSASLGEAYVNALLKQFPDLKGFDSIWCSTDEGGAAIIKHLTQKGLNIPRNVAVAGFNNSEFCLHTVPQLASVDACVKSSAEMITWMISDRIKNREKPIMTELIRMPLVKRDSIG